MPWPQRVIGDLAPVGRGRECAGGVGGAHRPRGCGGAGWRRSAVRVLRAGVNGGLPGSGDVAGAAAGAGRGAGGRARADRGAVLRRRAEPHAGLGAPPAGRRARSSAKRTTWPPRTPVRLAARLARRHGGTCWPGCCAAGGAGGGWSPPGPTVSLPTGAATATPAPPVPSRAAEEPVRPRGPDRPPPGRHGRPARRPARAAQEEGCHPAHDPCSGRGPDRPPAAAGACLIFDPGTRTLRTDTGDALAVTAGHAR